MKRKLPVVAIDGPAGAGKTTVTRGVARKLGYLLVDTGALYRAVALAAERQGLDWDDDSATGALAQELAEAQRIRCQPGEAGDCLVLLDGQDVTGQIRSQDIAEGASRVSANPLVRQALLDIQRQAGREGGVVLEGRDIGTVVFPDAEAKFFLTATVDVRARRRFEELVARGEQTELGRVKQEVERRDRRDTGRPIAPLKQAEDALLVDSSAMSFDQVVDHIVRQVRAIADDAGRE